MQINKQNVNLLISKAFEKADYNSAKFLAAIREDIDPMALVDEDDHITKVILKAILGAEDKGNDLDQVIGDLKYAASEITKALVALQSLDRQIESGNEPDYQGFVEHLAGWDGAGIPYGYGDLVTLAERYNTQVPHRDTAGNIQW